MPTQSDRYALRGGEWGRNRLAILAQDRWPDTSSFLTDIGLCPGMRCIDVGCGGGAVTIELAKWVGADGSVVGIDRDDEKLNLARKTALESNLDNVEFRNLAVSDWNEVDAYDLVYSRFVLQHLSSPADSLRRMWGAVRPGGTLAVEDVDHGGWSSVPSNPGIEYLKQGLMKVIGAYGGDASVGRRLEGLFREAGAPAPERHQVERGPFIPGAKILAPLTLESIAESLAAVDRSMASGYAEALKSLQLLADDPDSVIHGPTLYQVYGRKN